MEKFKEESKSETNLWIYEKLFFTANFPKKINLEKPTAGVTVIGACISSAIYMGFTEIYLLGFEGTGLLLELLNKETHFYGANEENNSKRYLAYHKDLYMKFRSHRSFYYLSLLSKKNNVKIINLTKGSMMKEFPSNELKNLFSDEKIN